MWGLGNLKEAEHGFDRVLWLNPTDIHISIAQTEDRHNQDGVVDLEIGRFLAAGF
jgi:hypothetical protein